MRYLFLYTIILFSTDLMAQEDQEHWEPYLAQYEKGVGSTVVNMSLKNEAPVRQYPYLLKAGVKIKHCGVEGLPEEEEWDILYKVSDKIKAAIDAHGPSKAPGIFSYQCWRTDYYYIRDTNLIRQQLLDVLKEALPGQEYKVEIKPDPKWEAYLLFLYPSDVIMEYISNEKVLSQLTKAGDSLTRPRQVDHWLYFKTEANRDQFIKYALQQKYKIEGKDFHKESKLQYSLHLSRTDKVDIASISALTLQLRKKAKEFDGDYDGWETFVIK